MIEDFLKLASNEAERARSIHGKIRTPHEALGLLEEEFWEVKLEIFKKVPDKCELLKELTQVVALCARLAEDCGLMTEELPKVYSNGQTQDSIRIKGDE